MAEIALSGKRGNGKVTIVDESTFTAYGHLSWFLGDTGYAMRRPRLDDGTNVTIRLHRLVTNAPEGMVVDHLNGNKLDNRLSNLRVCTQKQNARNLKNIKGYSYDKKKQNWIVRYRHDYYGRYATEDEARKAYQLAASGVPYVKTRRKYWNLPPGIQKQFGRYKVVPQKNGKRYWLGAFATIEEAQNKLTEWQERG